VESIIRIKINLRVKVFIFIGLLSRESNLSSELTRAEHKAFKMEKPKNDERHAIEALA
jgi:hypothetical protein